MIDIRLLKAKAKIEEEVRASKLWLIQKEDVEYTNFISDPLNEKLVKSAKDKIISQLKVNDEEWLQRELDLDSQELALKIINTRYETLSITLRALGNPQSGVDINMFNGLQKLYMEDLGI